MDGTRIVSTSVAVAAVMCASACGGSRPAGAVGRSDAASASADVIEFCTSFQNAVRQLAGNLGRVDDVHTALPKAIAALRVSLVRAPTDIRPDINASLRDWTTVDTYMQGMLNQRELARTPPAAVARPLDDWSRRIEHIEPWLHTHCRGVGH